MLTQGIGCQQVTWCSHRDQNLSIGFSPLICRITSWGEFIARIIKQKLRIRSDKMLDISFSSGNFLFFYEKKCYPQLVLVSTSRSASHQGYVAVLEGNPIRDIAEGWLERLLNKMEPWEYRIVGIQYANLLLGSWNRSSNFGYSFMYKLYKR